MLNMRFSRFRLWLLVLISSVNCVKIPIENRFLPSIESDSFAQSYYLNSRISFLTLNTSFQKDTTDTIFYSSGSSNVISISSRSLCAIHLQAIIEKIRTAQHEVGTLDFLDSFAKPGPGIRNGNLNWHGNRLQCESTRISMDSSETRSSTFHGKYCQARWNTQLASGHPLSHSTGVCIPNTCHDEDFRYLKAFLEKFFFLKISGSSRVSEISCKEEKFLQNGTIIFYCLCFGLLTLGIFSTIYDYFVQKPEVTTRNIGQSVWTFFSIPRNLASLSGENVSENDVLIIRYVRAMCAIVVVVAHVVMMLVSELALDPGLILDSTQILTIFTGFLWISLRSMMTIFFFLTGYYIHSDYTKLNQNFNPFISFLKAYIRLSPSYYFAAIFQSLFASKFGFGSNLSFGYFYIDRSVCSKFYFEIFSYFYNHLSYKNLCLPAFWSQSVTLQLYLLGAFLVWLLLRSSFSGLTSIVFMMIYGFVLSHQIFSNLHINFPLGPSENLNRSENFMRLERDTRVLFEDFYTSTPAWSSSIMMGIIFAYTLPRIQKASHHLQKRIFLSTSVIIIIFYSILCGVNISMLSYTAYSLVIAICPLGIALILSLLIFIFHPQSNFLKYKLSSKTSPFLVHFSRLSYPLYLIHWSVITIVFNPFPFLPIQDAFSAISSFCGLLLITYIASILLYIFIERPVQNIRKKLNV
ncbi:uncharacterized protein LOC141856754 [Brevipalpus obovatus]|uniref:uncharacterized protein LOC141856754 n=1 Tax=Brevipalpus obovatus TaxID=246614 RepID=UPI003D9F3AFA